MFNVGDVVTIEAAVAKDGTKHLGLLKAMHFADGHTVVFGSAADSEARIIPVDSHRMAERGGVK